MMWKQPKARLVSPEEKLGDGRHKNGTIFSRPSWYHQHIVFPLTALVRTQTHSFTSSSLLCTFKCTFFYHRAMFLPCLHSLVFFLFACLFLSFSIPVSHVVEVDIQAQSGHWNIHLLCNHPICFLTPIDVLLFALQQEWTCAKTEMRYGRYRAQVTKVDWGARE